MEIEPLRPFFGRMGGKSKIANNLISHFPDPNSYTTYVEPFIGAGNIFFRKPYKSKIEVINDLDDMVYSIFQGVKREGQVIEKLKPISYLSKEQFNKLRENASNWIDYLFLIKTSFFASGKSYDYPKEKNKLILTNTDFNKLKNRLKDVKITHLDFQTLIKKYNKPTTFFYLDPPYEDSKDYSNSVNPEDVYNAVKTIKGKFMLSYNDSPLIRKLFKEYNIHTIETIYEHTALTKKRVISEVYITNY
jgi:DNA adenine methylase